MGRKPKFRPRITRVKLNPEQAVLTCDCYNVGANLHTPILGSSLTRRFLCFSGVKAGQTVSIYASPGERIVYGLTHGSSASS